MNLALSNGSYEIYDDVNNVSRLVLDPNGRLLVGTTTDVTGGAGNALLQVRTAGGAQFVLARNQGDPVASDEMGRIRFISNAGSSTGDIAQISGQAEDSLTASNKAGRLAFFTTPSGSTTPTERLRIASTGALGLSGANYGTSGQVLTSQGSGSAPQWSTIASDSISEGNTSAEVVDTGSDGHFKVTTEGTEALRVDSSGRLLVGTSTAAEIGSSSDWQFQLAAAGGATGAAMSRFSNDIGPARFNFVKSRNGSVGSNTIVQSGDVLGAISFLGDDGSTFNSSGAEIKAEVDGTPGTNDMPGRLVFSTTADGASSSTERMRIDSAGRLLVGTSSAPSYASTVVLQGTSSGPTDTARLVFSRNSTISNSGLGRIHFGKGSLEGAEILVVGEGTWTEGSSHPTNIRFLTAASGSSSPAERMRITANGDLLFNSGYGSAATAYGCRAWVNFSGATPSIRASGNVSSVSKTAAGDYTINFTNAMPDTSYTTAFGGSSQTFGTSWSIQEQFDSPVRTTSAVRLYVLNSAGTPFDAGIICVHIFR